MRHQSTDIARLHNAYGYPPFWKRSNSFESLCKTIIEQQVSLASAKAVYERLKEFTGNIAPAQMAALTVDEYRRCGVTRQKSNYLVLLSLRVLQEPDFFSTLEKLDNDTVRERLISLKGIGRWTANVYMLVALNRIDIYPDVDVALINSIAYEIFAGKKIDNETAKNYVARFSPLQSIACLYFYHAYIVRRKVVFVP